MTQNPNCCRVAAKKKSSACGCAGRREQRPDERERLELVQVAQHGSDAGDPLPVDPGARVGRRRRGRRRLQQRLGPDPLHHLGGRGHAASRRPHRAADPAGAGRRVGAGRRCRRRRWGRARVTATPATSVARSPWTTLAPCSPRVTKSSLPGARAGGLQAAEQRQRLALVAEEDVGACEDPAHRLGPLVDGAHVGAAGDAAAARPELVEQGELLSRLRHGDQEDQPPSPFPRSSGRSPGPRAASARTRASSISVRPSGWWAISKRRQLLGRHRRAAPVDQLGCLRQLRRHRLGTRRHHYAPARRPGRPPARCRGRRRRRSAPCGRRSGECPATPRRRPPGDPWFARARRVVPGQACQIAADTARPTEMPSSCW